MNLSKLKYLVFLVMVTFLFHNCGKENRLKTRIKKMPSKRLQSYHFDQNSSLISRVKASPGFVLRIWQKWDQKSNYTSYTPNVREMKIIKKYLAALPIGYKKILTKRLVGIYFINNYLGSGGSDVVFNDDDEIYCYMIFNSKVLKTTMSNLLTYKENTCFVNNDNRYKIKIDCGKKHNAFNYILLHEASHVIDMIKRITPYMNKSMNKVLLSMGHSVPKKTAFTNYIWATINNTITNYSFRKSVTFYGMNKGPKINISQSPLIYERLAKTPFASLYGSLNWGEDFAEFFAFYHITQILKQKYIIQLFKNNKLIYAYEPMKSLKVQKRFFLMKLFYK